ncbi:neuronal acetylcholine receptor subunit alpha-3-like [Diorhabda sublineata]|uniref:neuronal acetylcholine receptor subunit alpha-3-like n=1 Tax=Diorhabda sublineata TaxID=1163346 RepID=UPI0024E0DF21|nr:neuronal acetylcholine receptor subunit alpha-3-like [Diorhabda sublineata]
MCSSRKFIFILFILSCDAEELQCPPSNSETTYVKLKDAVLCNYDSSVRPVANHQNKTNISFKFIMKYFNYEIITSTFSVDAWLSLYWKDQHLTWKPSDHENIQNIYLYSYEIWTPDLSLYNLANQGEDPELISTTRCMINYKGVVLCVPPVHLDVLCVPNLSKYPFDKQDCKLRIGSWMHKGEEIDMVIDKSVLNTEELLPNGEWEILGHSTVKHRGIYPCCPNNTYPSIDVNISIKRLAGSHAASMVIPCIVCVILTLVTLVLSAIDRERLILSYVSLVCHYMQVQYVSWQLPLKGDNIPLIIIFSRDSLLMSVFALLFTLVFKSIMLKKTTPPGWISCIVSTIINCKPGQMILLSDYTTKETAAAKGEEDGDAIVNSTNIATTNQDWELFGKLLDKIFFIVYVLTYFVMIISFLP